MSELQCLKPDTSLPVLFRWGQTIAIFNACTPGGLTPFVMTRAVASPIPSMATLVAKASGGGEELQRLIAEYMGTMEGLVDYPATLSVGDQGQVFLGYYNLINKLPLPPKYGERSARKSEWEEVDWELTDADIAERMNVSQAAVLKQRKKRAPKPAEG